MKTHSRSAGSITLLVLVFGAIFFTLLAALSSFVLVENHAQDVTREQDEAFSVAEAGLQYYHWFLSHFPNDLEDGTGHAGPYPYTVNDPEGGSAGTASLTINANTACGQTTSIDITSEGTPADAPGVSETVWARYAHPSVAAYSYIVNASVWAGSDRIINGPYHSNGGVRMDGTTNAPVTSSVSTWTCTSDFGCSGNPTEPGVFGAGPNQTLWSYPTPQVDFAGIAADFSSLKSTAQTSGIYLPRYSSGSSGSSTYHNGYHLIFNSNGTVTVKKVSATTALSNVELIDNPTAYTTDYTLIKTEANYQTYTIPANCGLIFVEDNTWVEGTIPSKVTLVVANVTTTGVNPDVVLTNNIQYAATDGSDGLTIIGDHDILIAPNSPQNMTLDGIFIAQGGAFGRNYYANSSHSGCNSAYEPRTSLTILGSTVSDLRTGTQWEGGCGGSNNAGYLSRVDAFDRTLTSDPPPFTPITSSDFQFVDWKQE